jgi:RNA-directed DNA polymerase
MEYDVFVCHAKEDKEQVVVPLVKELRAAGFRVWFDEDEIGWGTSVTGAIDEGLAKSRFVLVVLSDTSHKKEWVIKEMRAALSQEIASKSTRVLPLIVGDEATKKSIFDAFSMMRDKRYLEWCPGDNGPIIDALKSIVP